MQKIISGLFLTQAALLVSLTACSQATVKNSAAEAKTEETKAYNYVSMENFSYDMAQFVGLKENDSFEEAEVKIKAVFKAYDGHTEPTDIRMDSAVVEAGWRQVLVTQNGLMDGTVEGQQLLAVFDDENKLISYGMRIKCYNEAGNSDWQATGC